MKAIKYMRGQGVSAEQWDAARRKWIAEVSPLCGGEDVVAAAMFRQGGTAALKAVNTLAPRLGGIGGQMLGRSLTQMARKRRAGGLPERVLLAVTPTRLYAFDYSHEISRSRRERESGTPTEVAVWDRADIRCYAKRSGTMTALTVESPSEGEKATLVGGSVADDPLSQEVIRALGTVA